MEENIHEWHKKKRAKYDSIQLSAEANSWRIQTLILEVGSRGFIPPSFRASLRQLGFLNQEVKILADACSLMAQRCSYTRRLDSTILIPNFSSSSTSTYPPSS